MLQAIKISGLCFLVLLIPLTVIADSNVVSTQPMKPLQMNGDMLPVTSKILRSAQDVEEALRLDISTRIISRTDWAGSASSMSDLLSLDETMNSNQTRRGGVWPVVMSLLVPGAGEIYMGYYKRGAALVASEALMWTGYLYYHGKGLDEREEYERFADTHWTLDHWRLYHLDAYPLDLTFAELDSIGMEKWKGGGSWPAYHPWIDKSVDKQGYYEVIGKYDWFISGWSDFDPTEDPLEHHTDLRTEYRSMRKESNDHLKTSDRFIYTSIAVRTFSLVQTIILSRYAGRESASGAIRLGENLDLALRAKGINATEFAFEYNF
ncbi:MAG: hypothetical protein ABIA59_06070 [Candidatus Latescibacterota bacterium]